MSKAKIKKPNKKTANRLIKSGRLKFDKTFLIVTMAVVIATGGYLLYKGTHAATIYPPQIYNLSQYPVLRPSNAANYPYAYNQMAYFLDADLGGNTGILNRPFDTFVTSKIKSFQSFYGLTVDGIVGPQTWTTLLKVWNNLDYTTRGGSYGGNPNVALSAGYGGYLFTGHCPGVGYKLTIHVVLYGSLASTVPTQCSAVGKTVQISSYNFSHPVYKGQIMLAVWYRPTSTKPFLSNYEFIYLP